MDPVRPAVPPGMELVNYRGHGDVGDLYVLRPENGQTVSMWRPSGDELAELNGGGLVVLVTYCEPIPPLSLYTIDAGAGAADAMPNRFRNVPELDDPERQ